LRVKLVNTTWCFENTGKSRINFGSSPLWLASPIEDAFAPLPPWLRAGLAITQPTRLFREDHDDARNGSKSGVRPDARADGAGKRRRYRHVLQRPGDFLGRNLPQAVLNFEGIATDTGFRDFGTSYHTGNVTFTSPSSPFFRDVLVVGKNSQTLGAPFDSAILIPLSEPSSLVATFDPGSNVTAVGGFFLNTFGDFQAPGTFQLTGSTGVVDLRSVTMGIATSGKPKTFFGYTVTGDTISSLSVSTGVDGPAFDDFTYGTTAATPIPEPRSCLLVTLGAALAIAVVRGFRDPHSSD
jgi:hypothetical protein